MILVKSFVKLISRNFPGSLASLRLCIEIPFLLQYLHIKTKLEVATLSQFFFFFVTSWNGQPIKHFKSLKKRKKKD